MKRVLSIAGGVPTNRTTEQDDDVALEAYRELDFRQAEFFHFLDRELLKIEDFYKEKEDEATERLKVLHEQLHIMRNERVKELNAAERQKRKQRISTDVPAAEPEPEPETDQSRALSLLPGGEHLQQYKNSVVSQMDNALDKLDKMRTGQIGKSSKAMRDLGTPPSFRMDPDNRDYTRRPQADVTYRVAKRKLKTAFVEYYRALELLKNYAMLNQTAFRKICKKCDKTIAEQPGKTYMHQKVNRARFVDSQTVDGLMRYVL